MFLSNSTNLSLISVSLVVSASLIVVLSRTWRIVLLALLMQYIAVGMLVIELGSLARSGLRILIGGLICLILFLTVSRTEQGRDTLRWPAVDRRWVSEITFRLAAIGLVGIGVFGSSVADWLPSLPEALVLASAWLIAAGLVIVLVSRPFFGIGIGLLTIESGVETLYTALDPRLGPAGLLAASGLLLALMIAIAVAGLDQQGPVS